MQYILVAVTVGVVRVVSDTVVSVRVVKVVALVVVSDNVDGTDVVSVAAEDNIHLSDR